MAYIYWSVVTEHRQVCPQNQAQRVPSQKRTNSTLLMCQVVQYNMFTSQFWTTLPGKTLFRKILNAFDPLWTCMSGSLLSPYQSVFSEKPHSVGSHVLVRYQTKARIVSDPFMRSELILCLSHDLQLSSCDILKPLRQNTGGGVFTNLDVTKFLHAHLARNCRGHILWEWFCIKYILWQWVEEFSVRMGHWKG